MLFFCGNNYQLDHLFYHQMNCYPRQVLTTMAYSTDVIYFYDQIMFYKLDDGKKIPKMQLRSIRGIFLGFSDRPSNNVHSILNRNTRCCNHQFYAVIDDLFSNVLNTNSGGIFSLAMRGLSYHRNSCKF